MSHGGYPNIVALNNVDIQSPPRMKTGWNPISEQQKNIMTSRRCQKLKQVLRGSLNFWQFDNPRGLRFTSGFRSSCCFCCSRKSCFMFAALPFLRFFSKKKDDSAHSNTKSFACPKKSLSWFLYFFFAAVIFQSMKSWLFQKPGFPGPFHNPQTTKASIISYKKNQGPILHHGSILHHRSFQPLGFCC